MNSLDICPESSKKRVESFSAPTFSSSIQPSLHSETERVINSYRSGSFCSLKKLPSKLKAGEVESLRIKNICRNRCSNPGDAFKASKVNSYFSPLQYQFSDYSKLETQNKTELEYNNLRMQSFSRKPFSYPSRRIKLKNEDIFEDSNFKYPEIGPGMDIIDLKDVIRTDLSKSSQYAHGPFRVGGGYGKSVSQDSMKSYQLVQEW